MINRADIEKVFIEQLNKIIDKELRDKVVEVWVSAANTGKWDNIEELYKVPFTLLTDTKGISFIEHTKAVTEGAVSLAKVQLEIYKKMPYKIDMDRLVAGGLLHDVGKLLEYESDGNGGYKQSHLGRCARHPISGAILAAQAGLPGEIINTIGCHAKEGDGRPQVVETVLIHQADFATFNPMVMLNNNKLIV